MNAQPRIEQQPLQVLVPTVEAEVVEEVVVPREQLLSDLPAYIRTGNATMVWETIDQFAAKGIQADLVRGMDDDWTGEQMAHFSLVEIALAFSQTDIAVDLIVKGQHPVLNRIYTKINDETKEEDGVLEAECHPLKIAVQNKDWPSLCNIWKAAKNAWTFEHF